MRARVAGQLAAAMLAREFLRAVDGGEGRRSPQCRHRPGDPRRATVRRLRVREPWTPGTQERTVMQ